MRWLKGLVIGMGILILAGLTLVIVTVVKRANAPVKTETSVSLPAGPGSRASDIGDRRIAIPSGAVAEDVTSDTRRLVVRLRLASGKTALLLIDAATGDKIGLITLDDAARAGAAAGTE